MALFHVECPVRKARVASNLQCLLQVSETSNQMLKSISNGDWMISFRIHRITCCVRKMSWKSHSGKEWSPEFNGRPIKWIVTISIVEQVLEERSECSAHCMDR